MFIMPATRDKTRRTTCTNQYLEYSARIRYVTATRYAICAHHYKLRNEKQHCLPMMTISPVRLYYAVSLHMRAVWLRGARGRMCRFESSFLCLCFYFLSALLPSI